MPQFLFLLDQNGKVRDIANNKLCFGNLSHRSEPLLTGDNLTGAEEMTNHCGFGKDSFRCCQTGILYVARPLLNKQDSHKCKMHFVRLVDTSNNKELAR